MNGVNNNGVSLVTETLRYDRLNRITRMCDGASCSSYRILAYVGDTDWLARVVNQDGVTLYEFQYANGRPLRVDSPYPPYYASSYFVFNWHGDGSGAVGSDGNYTNPWADWGAWGELDGSVDYYGAWNGAQGYLHFYGFNGGTDFSNGLYSVHGRWWNPATGLFMSPDDKGEYFYGSGQDAVNWVWAQFLSGGTYQFSKNNLDALSPAVNLLSPGSYQNYLDYSERIEASLPESLPFQAGRLFGTTVTLAQSFEEVTTVGPGLIVAGTGVTCLATGLETASVGCIAGAGASVVAGGAVIVHGLSVEAYSISNGYQILFAKGRGGRRFSVNQMDKEVQRGKAPPTIVRVDPPRAPFEKPNVHFIDGSALNSDGTWKHGSRVLTNAEKDWLSSWGWTLPDE